MVLTTPRQELLASPELPVIRQIFDRIASRYDFVNSLLSLRLDGFWRRRAVRQTLEGEERTILDLGVGTGKFLEAFLPKRDWKTVLGIDFSSEMLLRARSRLPDRCRFICADIHDLPLKDESFDLVVSGFTLRSVKDRAHFFSEVRRVLRPGGKMSLLCLTRPHSRLGSLLYTPYLKFYLPLVGGLISSEKTAYRFLSESIQAFPSPDRITEELLRAGFRGVAAFGLSFGIVTHLLGRS